MKKLFMTMLLLPLIGAVIAQDYVRRGVEDYESVRYAVFFEGTNINATGFESEKLSKVGKWLKDNKDLKVVITGWAEPTKSEANDKAVAKKRAEVAKSYLMRNYKIAADRITVNEGGVDKDNTKTGISRRVDFSIIAQREVFLEPVFTDPKPEKAPKAVTPVLRQEKTLAMKGSDAVYTDEPQATEAKDKSKVSGNFYLGVGAGTAFGISTFSTATQDGMTPSIAAQIFAGYKFTPVVSAELALGYTKFEMNSPDLFKDVYYGNGQRLLVTPTIYSYPVASYSDLTSKSTLYSVTAKVNFDLTAINNKADFKRWAFLASPKIGFAYSDAEITGDGYTKATIASNEVSAAVKASESNTHITMGADVSAVYSFSERYALRLTTGADYLTGKGIDGLPQEEVKSNFNWATNLNFIIKF
ncbi:MAG: OmpA family protein [Rikenellaceae bacterium]